MQVTHSDYGASNLEENMNFFIKGNYANSDIKINDESEFIIPEAWEKYFDSEDPEYKEFIRLKKKIR